MLISSKTKMRTFIGISVLIILIMCVYGISCIPSSEEKIREKREFSCDTSQIENRLVKLEEEIREKSKKLNFEVSRNSGRMSTLRAANDDVQAVLENLRSEFSKFSTGTESNSRANQSEGFDAKLDVLGENLQNALDALMTNSAEIKSLKQEVEKMKNFTEKILINNHQFFYDSPTRRRSVRHIINKSPKISYEKPKDCIDLKTQGKKSGVYKIYPEEFPYGFLVLCEMESRGGGWTVIQNRYDGTQNFYLNFRDYRDGFGNLAGEFWLGLENIHHLTGHEVNELLVELIDFTSTSKYAHYGSFSIGSEKEGFSLKLLGNYEGNAGDSLIYQTGSRFSTKDMDQDEWEEGSCAKSHGGAWWYKSCDTSNLNGKYLSGELPENHKYTGMYWGGFRGAQYSLKQARMMVRPRDKELPGNERNMLIK